MMDPAITQDGGDPLLAALKLQQRADISEIAASAQSGPGQV